MQGEKVLFTCVDSFSNLSEFDLLMEGTIKEDDDVFLFVDILMRSRGLPNIFKRPTVEGSEGLVGVVVTDLA